MNHFCPHQGENLQEEKSCPALEHSTCTPSGRGPPELPALTASAYFHPPAFPCAPKLREPWRLRQEGHVPEDSRAGHLLGH